MIIVPDQLDSSDPLETLEVVVSKVFDGDGFLARVWNPLRNVWVEGVPFRFAFIDAPEMQQPSGLESKAFLNRLIAGKTLRLEPIGKESTGYMPFDAYRRVLCTGYLTEQMPVGRVDYYHSGRIGAGAVKQARPVTRNVELEMIVNGWAWVVERWAFDREGEYFDAQDDAQSNRRGLWAMDHPEPPWLFKQRQRRGRRVTLNRPHGPLL